MTIESSVPELVAKKDVSGLTELFERTPDSLKRSAAGEALVQLGMPGIEVVASAAESGDIGIRVAARMVLEDSVEKLVDARATSALVHVLASRYPNTRLRAAEALVALDWKPASELEEIAFYVAMQEWNALIRFGPPAANAMLEVFPVNDRSDPEIERAIRQIGDPQAVARLERAKGQKRKMRAGCMVVCLVPFIGAVAYLILYPPSKMEIGNIAVDVVWAILALGGLGALFGLLRKRKK